MLPTISTARLRLRPIVPRDADDLYAVFSDPEVTRYWSSPPLPDRAAAVALAARIAGQDHDGAVLQWAITRRDDDRLLGTCTLADIDLTHRRGALGYALGRASWGQGIAREAVRGVLELAFEGLDLHRVGADVDPRNQRSLRLLESLGFTREGLQRECYLVMNEWQDAVMFGLLRGEWPG